MVRRPLGDPSPQKTDQPAPEALLPELLSQKCREPKFIEALTRILAAVRSTRFIHPEICEQELLRDLLLAQLRGLHPVPQTPS
jgi:hypothetical protein